MTSISRNEEATKKAEKAKLSKEVFPNLIMSLKRQDVMSLKTSHARLFTSFQFSSLYSLYIRLCPFLPNPNPIHGQIRLDVRNQMSYVFLKIVA